MTTKFPTANTADPRTILSLLRLIFNSVSSGFFILIILVRNRTRRDKSKMTIKMSISIKAHYS